jgi:deazaflavin-dependent oxidoreductase (nitroreductase family)
MTMSEYIPSPRSWVSEHVEQYEGSGGTEGAIFITPEFTEGLRMILVTHKGRKTGAIRKTPLNRVVAGNSYLLVGSKEGAPQNPLWYHNLKADPNVEIRDGTEVYSMQVREAVDPIEKQRLWKLAVEVFPRYQEYQDKTERAIPVFIAELTR